MGDNGDSQLGSKSKDLIENKQPEQGNALNEQAASLLVGRDPGNQIENILRANGLLNVKQTPVETQPTILDDIVKHNHLARLGLVTIEGAGYAAPGVVNAAIHDLTHPVQALEKGGTALAIGLAMRAALPKSGAARAAAATAFTYFLARDAAVPVGKAFSDVWGAEDHNTVNLAAQEMGDALGMFGWDAYWGMKIAMAGERLGERGMRGIMGEKRFNAFEAKKGDFLGSDQYFLGRHLNRLGNAVNRGSTTLADALAGKKPTNPGEKLTFEEKMARAEAAHGQHEGVRGQATMHKHGMRTTDGKDIGYSQTLDILLGGKDPRKMTAAQVAAESAKGDKFVTSRTESGLVVAEKPGLVVVENGTVKPAEAVKPGTDVKGSTPELAARVAAEVNPKNIAELARTAKKEMARLSDEQQQVIDLVEGSVGPVHASINPAHKALDPGYREWLAQMVALGNEVGGDASKLQQVAPLFFRGRDAAIGQMSADLGATGRNVHSMNLFSLEMYTGMKQRMNKAGIPANDVLAAKNPPLNLVARDGGAGPHTIPEINGIWDVDLVHWPRNMQELRMLRAGINGHENKHDQFGGILRFADSIREQVIGETVGKALGSKSTQMMDVPGHGQMSKKDLIVSILKAQANENTADIGGAAYTGPSGAMALGVLLQALRQGGKLETRNVFGKEMATRENPMGIEVHAMDTFRPKLVAEVLRQRADKDPLILEYAKQLDAYAEAAANQKGGDYVWASLDNPGQKISIPRAELDAVIPHLVSAQLNTPLKALNGKTYAEILPHLPTEMRRMDALSELMVDAIINKRPLESIPFNTQDYTMIQLQSAALPAALRLTGKGMKGEQVNAEINRVSDYLELQFHKHGDPHVAPLTPKATIAEIALNPALAARQAGRGLSSTIEGIRNWSNRDNFLIGQGGMAIGRDLFSTYVPGSASRALVEEGSKQTGTDGTTVGAGQPIEQQEASKRAGVPELPIDRVVIPPGNDGPSGRPRTIPRQQDPFLRNGRGENTIDLNELRRLQREGEQMINGQGSPAVKR